MRNIFKRKEKEQLRKCDLHLTINPKSPAQETFNNRIFFIPKALFNSELKVHFEWFIDNYEENESGFAERWVRQIGYEQIQKHIHTYTHTDQEVGKVVWGRLKDRQDSQPHPRSMSFEGPWRKESCEMRVCCQRGYIWPWVLVPLAAGCITVELAKNVRPLNAFLL